MALKLAKTVIGHLKDNQKQKFTARDIAEWIYKTYPEECEEKIQRSDALNSQTDLIQQLVAEIGSQRPRLQNKNPQLRTTEGRPRKYYYTEQSEIENSCAQNASAVEVPTRSSDRSY